MSYRNAAKGSNPAMRNAHLITTHAEKIEREHLGEKVVAWVQYKDAAARRLDYCKARGMAFDWDIHPHVVQFDGRTGEICILGTFNVQEREALKFVTDSFDLLHKSAEEAAERVRENPRRQKPRISLGLHIELIGRLNAQLPPRLQREVDPDVRKLAIMPDLSRDCGEN